MRKRISIFIGILAIICGIWFISSGFLLRKDVGIIDYTVSSDETEITIKTMLLSSAGFIREAKTTIEGDKMYVEFYQTFGGLNSKIGAKDEFTLKLNDECREIYFYGMDNEASLRFKKSDDTNEWEIIENE